MKAARIFGMLLILISLSSCTDFFGKGQQGNKSAANANTLSLIIEE